MQRPTHQTICGTLQREANWKCLILTLLIYGCLGAITWCRLAEVTKVIINFSLYPIKSTRQMSPCDDGYIYIPIAFMVMLYLVYLVECWHCTARIELTCQVDVNGVLDKIRQMREAMPIVWWKAICYHYVRRKRQITRYRNGDAYTSTQVYYERVNSHVAGSCFVFAYCGVKDISKELLLDARDPITKIRFSKGFAFSNMEAAAEFEDQRTRFFAEQERYDDYMEMREGLDLTNVSNFKEYVVAYGDPDQMPWYSSTAVFWVFSFLLLSWPLRMIIEYNTAYVHYQVTKLFGVNYDVCGTTPTTTPGIDAESGGLPFTNQSNVYSSRGQLSHGSTVDSGEMEWRIRENFAIVPSYSESLLMDSGSPNNCTNNTITTSQPKEDFIQPINTDNNANIPNVQLPRLPTTRSSYSVRGLANGTIGRNTVSRMSWGGIFTSNSRSSLNRGVAPGSNETGGIQRRASLLGNRVVYLYHPSPLIEHSLDDPFQGRTVTTPTEDPPDYEDALRFPALTRLRRSLTDRGDICRRTREHRWSSACNDTAREGLVVAETEEIRVQNGRGRPYISIETSL